MPNVEQLKAEIKKEIMTEVRNGISELRDSLNKDREKDVSAVNHNFDDVYKRLDELSGRRKR